MVPYAYTYRLHPASHYATAALAWAYAAEGGGVVGFARLRRGLFCAALAAAPAVEG